MMTLRSLGLAVVAVICCTAQSHAQAEPPVLAVAEIQYIDTSGEVVDQSADHFRRLREFEAAMRTNLAASGKVKTAALDCPPNACSVGDIEADQLLGKAEAAGAGYLLISSFHKLSTLVQWAKFDLIDVKTHNVVFNRLVTFRGDNDKAWQHAASFIVREILDHEDQ
jgi:hypothetical protein